MHRSGLPFRGLLLTPRLLPGSPAPAGGPEHTVVTAAAQLSTGVCAAPAPTTRSSTTRLLQSRPRGGSKPRPPSHAPGFPFSHASHGPQGHAQTSHAPTGLSRSRPFPATPPRGSPQGHALPGHAPSHIPKLPSEQKAGLPGLTSSQNTTAKRVQGGLRCTRGVD